MILQCDEGMMSMKGKNRRKRRRKEGIGCIGSSGWAFLSRSLAAIVYADRRERRLLLFLLFGAVLALWLFGLLGLFGLPPASLYLSGVVGISLGFVIRSLARWKRKRTHGTDVS